MAQRARQQELLLVAAGQRVDGGLGTAACECPSARSTRGRAALLAGAQEPAVGGKEEVLAHAQRRHQALALPVFGHEARAAAASHATRRAAAAAQRWLRAPRCVRRRPVRPDRPPRRADREREATHVRRRLKSRTSSGASAPAGASSLRPDADCRHVAADHRAHQVGSVDVAHRVGRHASAVAQHGDPIGDAEHLVEPMADVEDAGTAAAPARALRRTAAPPRRRRARRSARRAAADRPAPRSARASCTCLRWLARAASPSRAPGAAGSRSQRSASAAAARIARARRRPSRPRSSRRGRSMPPRRDREAAPSPAAPRRGARRAHEATAPARGRRRRPAPAAASTCRRRSRRRPRAPRPAARRDRRRRAPWSRRSARRGRCSESNGRSLARVGTTTRPSTTPNSSCSTQRRGPSAPYSVRRLKAPAAPPGRS